MGYGKYEYCGYCRYCIADNAREDIKNGKFKCDREKIWVYADARPEKFNCFWQVASWNLSDRDKAIKLSQEYQGFYITTAIFKKLLNSGAFKPDDLNVLYAFRNEYLNQTSENSLFIGDYDLFGPKIAKILTLKDRDGSLSRGLYEFYLKGTLDLINKEDLEGASDLYQSMYRRLREEFIFGPMKIREIKPQLNISKNI